MTAFLGHRKTDWKILIYGCQFALAKFLVDNHQNIEISLVVTCCKNEKNLINKYLEMNYE
jgi:hypothetical protein